MLTFSPDGDTADLQLRAVIFYLTTFGSIDGDFDAQERFFVHGYVRALVAHRVNDAVPAEQTAMRAELTDRYTVHFLQVAEASTSRCKTFSPKRWLMMKMPTPLSRPG